MQDLSKKMPVWIAPQNSLLAFAKKMPGLNSPDYIIKAPGAV
jgi:hypothetical protein